MKPPPRTTVTLADVAAAAGVSKAAVSGVLNGKPRVSATTAQRIKDAAKNLGYHANPTARQLRSGRTDAVGFVIPELHRPYFGELATHLANQLEQQGRHLVIQRSGGSREQELAAAQFAQLRRYDAVIMSVLGVDPPDLESLGFTIPLVLLGEKSMPGAHPQVLMDNETGAFEAVKHLLTRGAQHIVMLGGSHSPDRNDMTRRRTQGYRTAHTTLGQPLIEELIIELGGVGAESGYTATTQLIADGHTFDAIFAVTDVVAMGALRALADAGLRVPHDVQVIGFDDIADCNYTVPRLTSVNPHKEHIATAVLDLIAVPNNDNRVITVPTTLNVRESTL
ncbi:LacI family DNA-binding transcriptional regulator [Jonesia quinghaiensis]|uniref:LacI family DNA-binding transcriptional regulator n=1 Tax=Jonesia quinghaiensis TaxID=262806 RepID=UPI0003F4BC53|nr:LacI family DNA-binding transcriptional regulator [Jonesia quinghaiensis]